MLYIYCGQWGLALACRAQPAPLPLSPQGRRPRAGKGGKMLSIFDWFGYRLADGERYRLIKSAGFSSVMILWGQQRGRGPEYRQAPETARAAGLAVENIHAPTVGQHDWWQEGLSGEDVAACYLQCIEDCRDLGVPVLVLHLPGDDHPLTPAGLDRVKRAVEKAERLGVNIALENLQNTGNLAAVFQAVDSARLGFCYDCCHHYNDTPGMDLLGLYGSRLMALHLHDNSGSSRSYCIQHRLPFDGGVPWEKVMGGIAAAHYKGVTALEPMYWDYQELPPDVFLYRAFEKAKRLEALRRP